MEALLLSLVTKLLTEGGTKGVELLLSWFRRETDRIKMAMPDLWEEIERVSRGDDLDAQSDLDVRLYERVEAIKARQPKP